MSVAMHVVSDQFWFAQAMLPDNMPADPAEWGAVWDDAWAVWCGCPL